MKRPNKGITSPSARASGKPMFDTAKYAGASGMEPLLETQEVLFRQPVIGKRSSIAGLPALDSSQQSLGVHYLRQSYLSRDVWHSYWRMLWKKFSAFETGCDTDWLNRHPELKLVGYGGLTANSDPTDVAKAWTTLTQHALYLSTHLVLKYVAIVNLAKKTGFGKFNSGMNATIRYSALNTIFSRIANMPVNKAYLEAHIGAMVELTLTSEATGFFLAVPDWLPLTQTYFEQHGDYSLTLDAAYLNARTARHCLVGELNKANDLRLEGVASWYGLGLTPVTAGHTGVKHLTKSAGHFIDHYLEQLQEEVDQWYNLFCNNDNPSLNLGVANSKTADFLASVGVFTDRVTYAEVSKYADSLAQVSLPEYAKANYRFLQGPGPVARRDISISVMVPFDTPLDHSFDLPTFDYVMRNLDNLSQLNEIPYVGLKIGNSSTIEAFLDGREAEIFNDASLEVFDRGVSVLAALKARINSVLVTQQRYVDPANVGAYIQGLSDPNVIAHPSLVKQGVFLPYYTASPMIDPCDRMTNGVFKILDLQEPNPRKNTWEDIVFQVTKKASHASGWTKALLTADAVIKDNWTQAWIDASTLAADTSFVRECGAKIGAVLLYLGDAAGLPPPLQLTRGDVALPMFGEVEDSAAETDINIIPAVPYRAVRPDFTLPPELGTGVFGSNNKGVDVAFNATKNGVVVTDLSYANISVVKETNLASHPLLIYSPVHTPALARPVAEYTDHGMGAYLASKVDYEKFSIPAVRPPARSSGKGSVPKEHDPSLAKKMEREERKNSRGGPHERGRPQFDKRRGFKDSRRPLPKEEWEKKGTVGLDDVTRGVAGESANPITDKLKD